MNDDNKKSPMEIIATRRKMQYATDAGTRMHDILRRITIGPTDTSNYPEIVAKIMSCPGAAEYFTNDAQTEVPIAGRINGKFISRRIDRMVIDHTNRRIKIMDYKTDTHPEQMRGKYITQLHEYCDIMHEIYHDFKITAVILWTHDWHMEYV